jgi:hypothetical protein
MQPQESNVHSFMIRLWQEEGETDTSPNRWRGHITHIPGNQRRYIEDLDAIKHFIGPYLRDTQTNENFMATPLEPDIS